MALADKLLQDRVAEIMERESFDYYSPRTGARFSKIDYLTARAIAGVTIAEAKLHNVPLAYAMGELRRESAFSPDAVNPNLQNPKVIWPTGAPGEQPPKGYREEMVSNGPGGDPDVAHRAFVRDDFAVTDWGIAQISGLNLDGMFSGDRERAKAAVLDPAFAVPYACRTYRALLDWAKERFPASDPFYIAALGYNKGRTGATSIIRRQRLPKESWMQFLKRAVAGHWHARAVMGFTRKFRDELGLQSP
ncbi:MAG: hypothetical protein ACREJ4_02600 [Candidatus Methylomirabilaceae bacterium]